MTGAPSLPAFLDELEARGVVFEAPPSGGIRVRGWRRLDEPERARVRAESAAIRALLVEDVQVLDRPLPRNRPDIREYVAPAGWVYFMKRYLKGVPEEQWTLDEVAVARLLFAAGHLRPGDY